MTAARFTAAAHRHAAEVFAQSDSAAQRAFAPALAQWAVNADRRAGALVSSAQPDLFLAALTQDQ